MQRKGERHREEKSERETRKTGDIQEEYVEEEEERSI